VVDSSKKHSLMVVGGHADDDVDLCGEDNADEKLQCLGKGQTIGLSPSLVDDPLFRKTLVTTARMGQSAVCMDKGTTLGKRTLSHRHNITLHTTLSNSTDNIVCTSLF
jgi:hypothetical protein